MKKILLAGLLMTGFFSFAQTYCIPEFSDGCSGGDMIDSFTIPSAGFNHANTGCSSGSYGDYTSMTINLNAGLSYDFSVTHGYSSQHVRVWIDFNNDGIFDDTTPELVASGTSSSVGGNDITSGMIIIPATVTPGTYRMRVGDRFLSDPIPCNIDGYGEAHDYKVVIGAVPTCLAPTGVTVSAVTSNSAHIAWTASSSAPNGGYEYYYSTSVTPPTATTTASGTNTTLSADLSMLTPATAYHVWVRSVCTATDKSLWSQMATFTTACVAVNVPYTLDFESLNTPNLPLCTSAVNDGSGNIWQTYNLADQGFTGNVLRYVYDSSNPANTWFFTNGINLTAGVSYRIRYKYGNAAGTVYAEKLKVAYGTSASSAGMTNTLADYPDVIISAATSAFVDFTPATTSTYYFGFQAYSDADMNRLYVDDINVAVTPTCSEPTVLTHSNITAAGASISWTASNPAPANGYEIYYSTANTAPTGTSTPNFTGVTATTYNIPSLAPNTTYYVWVRSACSASDKSIWSDYTTFTTLCATANLPYTLDFENVSVPDLPGCTENINAGSGSDWITDSAPSDIQGFDTNVLKYEYDFSSPADAWFFTQGLNLTAGMQYTISYKYGNNDTDYTEKLKVAFGTSANVSAMTNPIADYPSINDNTLHAESITFTVPTTGIYYFGFNAYSDANQYYLYLDDISITNANLAVSEVSQTKSGIKVYPNPFTDVLNISDVKNVKNIMVMDASGRLMKTIANPDSTIHLNELKQGMYLVTLEMKDGSKQTVKVIKK
ncbi:T9SS type A sorting domain-containing protein [Chryseobacterium sp. Tr-659]|uniref:fibronectin type III domain-containing protein n=1 Tax=Chryseobacterium sp. Tr-659 TaxID=2608340 RepID=UPI00142209D0|nr:fibronectin type III domain-containing protein [Chryseobacterium sp. Tr-659]NIF06721.1 T9SS type A sorting domain-containing protein [Chryseobacterium sp. Tr-659]